MKVFAVKHSWDNGLSYEDYRAYESYKLFSTQQKAESYYYLHVVEKYEGKYTLIEWQLDTQEQIVLDECPYVQCTSECSYDYEDHDPYEEDLYSQEDWWPNGIDPHDSIESAWKFIEGDGEETYNTPEWMEEYEEFCNEKSLKELNASLNALLADNCARRFCEDYNKIDESQPSLRELTIMKYDEEFLKLGFSKAWEAYKRLLNL